MVALLDNSWGGGGRKETIRYSAYGTPFGMVGGPAADANGSGAVNVSDFFVISGAFGESYGDPSYSVLADINLDGTVDASDSTIHSGQSGHSLGRGNLSRSPSLSGGVGNRVGYAGYAWEPVSSKYHVRHRVLDPLRGRWSRRDPLGYFDGESLYEYVSGRPLAATDARGLSRLELISPPQPDIYPEEEDEICEAISAIDTTIDDYGVGLITNCGKKKKGGGNGDNESCNDRRQSESYGPKTEQGNGCGAGLSVIIVPDNPSGFPFVNCCDAHDNCYVKCRGNVPRKQGQKSCDDTFRDCMYAKCAEFCPFDDIYCLHNCQAMAELYHTAVDWLGDGAYKSAQKKACVCCDPPQPHPDCAVADPM